MTESSEPNQRHRINAQELRSRLAGVKLSIQMNLGIATRRDQILALLLDDDRFECSSSLQVLERIIEKDHLHEVIDFADQPDLDRQAYLLSATPKPLLGLIQHSSKYRLLGHAAQVARSMKEILQMLQEDESK